MNVNHSTIPTPFEQLLAEFIEGTLAAERQASLAERVAGDSALRDLYVDQIVLHAMLRRERNATESCSAMETHGEVGSVPSNDEAAATANRREASSAGGGFAGISRPWPLSFVTAAVAVAALVMILAVVAAPGWRAPRRGAEPPTAEFPAPFAARVSGIRNAVWDGEPELRVGTNLRVNDEIHLQVGLVALTFDSGAKVVLTGPTRFRLLDRNRGYLTSGLLSASVPERAKGFTVATRSFEVVDLGTEFGLRHEERGRSEVHVFSGEVEIVPVEAENAPGGAANRPRRVVRGGEAVIVDAARGEIESQLADRAGFGPTELSRGVELLGFYPFEGDANDASGAGRHAARVGNIEFVEGREGQAARFSGNAESFLDLPIDTGVQRLPHMTWGAWIKPLFLDDSPRAILSTDDGGYDRVLTLDGRTGVGKQKFLPPRFAAFAGENRGVVSDAESEVAPERWTFIAASYDEPRKLLSLYVERPRADASGRRLKRIVFQNTNFGESADFIRVGNHPLLHVEPFHGDVDNVFIVKGCLTHAELEHVLAGGSEAILEFAARDDGGK